MPGGRYGGSGFVGGMAGNAIQEFLVQRELQNRQRQMDEMAAQRQAAEIAQRDEQLRLQREQEARIAAAQGQQQKDLETERGFRRATAIASNALPDDPVDAQTQSLLTEHGYGGQIRQVPGVVKLGPWQDGETPEMTPDQTVMRGGSQYLSQRAAAEERGALAADAEAGRNERADADRELKEMIARLTASGTATSRALADQLKQIQIDSAQEKLATTQTDRTKSADAAKQATQTAYDLITRLETHPGIDKATGAYEMRGFTQEAQDFNGIRDQLIAALALPNVGALKGAMSEKELAFVKNLSTRLDNHKLSKEETLKAIREAKTFLQNKLSGAPDAGGGGTVKMLSPDGRPLNVPAAQVEAAKARGATLAQ